MNPLQPIALARATRDDAQQAFIKAMLYVLLIVIAANAVGIAALIYIFKIMA